MRGHTATQGRIRTRRLARLSTRVASHYVYLKQYSIGFPLLAIREDGTWSSEIRRRRCDVRHGSAYRACYPNGGETIRVIHTLHSQTLSESVCKG